MNKFAYYCNDIIYKISNVNEYDEKCPNPAIITFDRTDGCPGLDLEYKCSGNTREYSKEFVSLCDYIEVGDYYKENKFIKNNGTDSGITYYEYIFSLELNKIISKITLDMINGKLTYNDDKEEFEKIVNHYSNLVDKKFLIKNKYNTCLTKIPCYGECQSGWLITVTSTEGVETKDINDFLHSSSVKDSIESYALTVANPILSTINKEATGFKY